MFLLDSDSHGDRYVCRKCDFVMCNNLWDQIRGNDPDARETIKGLMDEFSEDEDHMETIERNFVTYMCLLIQAGLDDSMIKAKLLSEMMTLGFFVDDEDDLEKSIAYMRGNIEANYGPIEKGD